MNVHYFSGTCVNTGFEYAYNFTRLINDSKLTDNERSDSYNEFHTLKSSILVLSVKIAEEPFMGGYQKKYIDTKKIYNKIKIIM